MGALSTTGSQVDATEARHDAALSPAMRGDLLIRSENGRIYLSEAGGEFRELPLGDTPEARRLSQLLDSSNAVTRPAGLRLSPTLLAGGGGAGFHWSPFRKAEDTPEQKTAPEQATPTDKAGAQPKASSPPSPRTTSGNRKE
jgi:hypothetical protein